MSRKHVEIELSLLVVDDEPQALEILGSLISLEYPDATVHLADGGQRGLELFQKHRPRVVITDVRMPGLDGIEMALRIKALGEPTGFIVVTANQEEGYLEKLVGLGPCYLLAKPVDFEKLQTALHACLAELAAAKA